MPENQIKYRIPTGYLIVGDYHVNNRETRRLETLSIGDYGKAKNIKADFLGYTREIDGVPNGPCMPLSEKWVITMSTQFGCPMTCTFCDVPAVGFRGNVGVEDFWDQLTVALGCFPEVRYTDRLNIHFARMGEPLFNFDNIFTFCKEVSNHRLVQQIHNLRLEVLHPVFTTMCPRAVKEDLLAFRLHAWAELKNEQYRGQAGLQLSINSTDEEQRQAMFDGKAHDLETIAEACLNLPNPVGRKYCLNFAYSSQFEIDAWRLKKLFPPHRFMAKITPIHETASSEAAGLETVQGYVSYDAYREPEERLKQAGYDVIVFVPSTDEERGLVTCGNAILSERSKGLGALSDV